MHFIRLVPLSIFYDTFFASCDPKKKKMDWPDPSFSILFILSTDTSFCLATTRARFAPHAAPPQTQCRASRPAAAHGLASAAPPLLRQQLFAVIGGAVSRLDASTLCVRVFGGVVNKSYHGILFVCQALLFRFSLLLLIVPRVEFLLSILDELFSDTIALS